MGNQHFVQIQDTMYIEGQLYGGVEPKSSISVMCYLLTNIVRNKRRAREAYLNYCKTWQMVAGTCHMGTCLLSQCTTFVRPLPQASCTTKRRGCMLLSCVLCEDLHYEHKHGHDKTSVNYWVSCWFARIFSKIKTGVSNRQTPQGLENDRHSPMKDTLLSKVLWSSKWQKERCCCQEVNPEPLA